MRWILAIAMTVLPALVCAQDAPALKTDKEKLSYAMGMDLGGQLKANSVDIDTALFIEGLRAALAGGKTLLTDAEAKAAISATSPFPRSSSNPARPCFLPTPSIRTAKQPFRERLIIT